LNQVLNDIWLTKGAVEMKKNMLAAVVMVAVIATASMVAADPPFGVGSAQVITDPDAQWWVAWVDVSGDSTPMLPGGEGLVLVQLDDVHLVYTNNPSGTMHLHAHGHLPLGGSVIAFDPIKGLILATLADVRTACAALSQVFPDACRGKSAMVLLNHDSTGMWCELNGIQSENWRTTTTRSGVTNSTCHVFP
jgi:hypothetical protein